MELSGNTDDMYFSQANSVTVTISHLSLNEKATVLNNDSVKQLFVAYNFLGIEPQELETPFSLPKPKANLPITYNFTKSKWLFDFHCKLISKFCQKVSSNHWFLACLTAFQVDMQKNYERRQYLAAMLLPDDPEQGR